MRFNCQCPADKKSVLLDGMDAVEIELAFSLNHSRRTKRGVVCKIRTGETKK
jgi:hypothetical protein